jgi:hypothetical protein
MEQFIFQFLLVLFGFFLGGIYPIILRSCDSYTKFFLLVFLIHIFENYWLQSLLFLFISLNEKIYFYPIDFFISQTKNSFNTLNLPKYFILLEIEIFLEYIKFGFFFGTFVDGLKLGS